MFVDEPDFTYYQFDCYTNDDYDQYLQVGFAVNSTENTSVIIPAGTYELKARTPENFAANNTLLVYPFTVQGTYGKIHYGCWYNTDYGTVINPLVSGTVEVLEDCTKLSKINMKITLKDNATTPHTVTAAYNGPVDQ